MRRHFSSFVLGLFVTLATASVGFAGEWVVLFDGSSLDGWTQKDGTAKYHIDGDTIVGTTNEGSPNSFLCTDKKYGNFELEFEVKVDQELNSGVQIRSHEQYIANDGTLRTRINGPQVEIEASGADGAEAAYIYGEATGRGWLVPDETRVPHKHFKDGKWNQFRVVANGPRIQTWINGNAVIDLTHEEIFRSHKSGYIGLQVHSVRKGSGPYQVAWKNIRIKELKK